MTPHCSIEVEVLVKDFTTRGCTGSVMKSGLKSCEHDFSLSLIYTIRSGEGFRREAMYLGLTPPPKNEPLRNGRKSSKIHPND